MFLMKPFSFSNLNGHYFVTIHFGASTQIYFDG